MGTTADSASLGCPGMERHLSAPRPGRPYTSSLARLLAMSERRLADRTDAIDLMAIADAIVRRQRGA